MTIATHARLDEYPFRIDPGAVMSGLLRRTAPGGVIVVAIMIAALSRTPLPRMVFRRTESDLISAANSAPYRSIIPRISGGFEYRPLEPPGRPGGQFGQRILSRRVSEVLEEVVRNAERDPTAADLHTLGIAQLLLRRNDSAVASLERAVCLEGQDKQLDIAIERTSSAELLNDLSCAYISRAHDSTTVVDLLRAVPAVECAWKISKTGVTAWNRALLYESLHLNRESAAAWRDFQLIESSEDWQSEARRHIRKVSKSTRKRRWSQLQPAIQNALRAGDAGRLAPYVRDFSAQVVTAGNQRLVSWAAASTTRSAESAASLSEARTAAAALRPIDPFLFDAVHAVDESITDGDRDRLEKIREGIRLLERGRQLYAERRTDQALALFLESASAFEQARSCMAIVARTVVASSLIFAQRYDEAGTQIARVTSDPVVRRYPRACGQSQWIAGMCHLAAGRPYEALQAYEIATRVFERIGDSGSLAALEDLKGEAYEHLGLGEESWRHRLRALEFKAEEGDVDRSEAIYGGAARAAVKLGQYAAALRFVDSVVDQKRDDPYSMAELLVLRGAIRQRLRAHSAAANDFKAAREALARLPPGAASAAVASDIRSVELLVGSQAAVDSAAADTAIRDAGRRGNKYRLVPLLRLRAGLVDRYGPSRREAAAETALQEMERQVSAIHDADVRLTAQRSLHDLYGSLIALAVSRGDLRRAVQLLDCERERSRDVQSDHPCAERPMDVIPSDAVILDYFTFGEGVIGFATQRGSIVARRLPISTSALELRARRFGEAIRNDDDTTTNTEATNLHDAVLAPFEQELRDARMLVIASSPTRTPLPFSALRSRRTSRYVIEDHEVVFTPGVSRLAATIQRDAELRAGEGSRFDILAVAPEYDRWSQLSALPLAAREAAIVCRDYRRSMRILGSDATTESFLRQAGRATVVHFAGHSIANASQPRYAALAFGGVNGTVASMLYAHQIARCRFPRTRLLVLASCSSAAEDGGTTMPPMSLADAFLDASVPGVVATLWAIDDDVSMSILPMFHEQIAAGAAAPSALRRAQLSVMKSAGPNHSRMRAWASYCFIGWHSGN